jgi:hypothetical protein
MSDRPQARSGCGHQPQAHAKTPSEDGSRSDLGQAAHQYSGPRPPQISLLAPGSEGDQTRTGLVRRHHLRTHARRPRLSLRRDGLVFAQGAGLGRFQHHENQSLSGSSGKRADLHRWDPGNFQHRPRFPIHLRRLDRTPAGSRNKNQHGRPRALARQRVHREAFADDQIRGNLSVRAFHGHGLTGGEMVRSRQRQAAPCDGWQPHPYDVLSQHSQCLIRHLARQPRRPHKHGHPPARRFWEASVLGSALHSAPLRCVLRLPLQLPKRETLATPLLTAIHDLLSLSRTPSSQLSLAPQWSNFRVHLKSAGS